MSRSAKLAAAAAFGGLLLAISMTSAMRSPTGIAAATQLPRETVSIAPSANELRRCRTVAEPDPTCDAAWDAGRRRFFRKDKKP